MRKSLVIGMGMLAFGVLWSACDKGGGPVSISGIEPREGAVQGDQPVKISGHNFRNDIGYTVYFGNKRAGAVTILDPETIVVATPRAESEGEVDVMIAADDGPAFRIKQGYRFLRPANAAEPSKATKQQF